MELSSNVKTWLKYIKAWQQSGLKQRAFCQKHGLNEKIFSSWKHRLKEHLPDNPVAYPVQTTPLVQVKLAEDLDSSKTKSGIDLSVGGKYKILIDVDFDSETLKRLLSVLAEV